MINQLGQLIITGVSGKSLTQEEKDFLKNSQIGGVIFFKHNYENPAQLAELVNEIQQCRDEFALFVSVDQEGGRVKRFKTHFTQFPSMLEIGEKDSPKLTFEVHQVMAKELQNCGVNINYSPCADIWTNPNNKVIADRAFGKDPINVEKHVSAAIRGLQTESVLACAKHFPGHGNTTKDSHYDLPYVKASLEELRATELIPFVRASKSRAEMIMMAHLVVDCIDPKLPCTLSKKAYDFCREELKYKKILITDDMEMKAIDDHFTPEQAAVMAIEAGADIILYRSMDRAKRAYQALEDAVTKQSLKRDVIEEKLERIKQAKQKYLSDYKPIYIPDITNKFSKNGDEEILNKISQA